MKVEIPDEWAEPVAMALTNAFSRGFNGTEPYTDLDVWRSVSGYERFMADARAALAAVIPKVRKAEREWVEALLGSNIEQYQAAAERTGEDVELHSFISSKAQALQLVLDAIRARNPA